MNVGIIKLLVIVLCFICACGIVLYVNHNKGKQITEKFDMKSTFNTALSNSLNEGYNKINTSRFNTIDNQIRLDNIASRVNKLLDTIQSTYNVVNNQTSQKNPITFY